MRQYLPISSFQSPDWQGKIRHVAAKHQYGMVLETADKFANAVVGGLGSQYQFLAAIGCVGIVLDDLNTVRQKQQADNDWWFGAIAYDYKNQLEHLVSQNRDGIGAQDICFFKPRYVITQNTEGTSIGYLPQHDTEESVRAWLKYVDGLTLGVHETVSVDCHPQMGFNDYIDNVGQIQQHIVRGDIYEMNFCMAFQGHHPKLDAESLYSRLITKSPVPFGAFAKFDTIYLMSASPERYVCKRGNRVFSQPIKGTAPRSVDAVEDEANKQALCNSEKERAENIMIVDLVRNDLAKVAKKGSVNVDELCGIYGYRQVFQMISTVSAELETGKDWLDVIKATFPMGSMTGAPKLRAMELIEHFENSKRGLYSGAVGYIAPNGDFDFNVVIRSLLYNAATGNLSFSVGSAITHLSDAEAEYTECLLKAKAILQVLGNNDLER